MQLHPFSQLLMSVNAHEQWMDFQTKARALCEGGCEYGPSVTSLDCGDGPAFATIKTCTNTCADCIRQALQHYAAEHRSDQPTLNAFQASRRAVGEPAIILDQFHTVGPSVREEQPHQGTGVLTTATA